MTRCRRRCSGWTRNRRPKKRSSSRAHPVLQKVYASAGGTIGGVPVGRCEQAQKYGGSIENRAQLIFEVVDVVLSSLPLSQVGIWLSPVSETFGCKDSAPRETYGFDLVYLSVVERRGSTQTTRASRRTAWRTTSAAFTMEC
ncbi:hypothetical protein PC120_g25250 [Phytophthora cactorum]|nr:hypothetical protein PC120_g25250 [Phytophthora cactorum]